MNASKKKKALRQIEAARRDLLLDHLGEALSHITGETEADAREMAVFVVDGNGSENVTAVRFLRTILRDFYGRVTDPVFEAIAAELDSMLVTGGGTTTTNTHNRRLAEFKARIAGRPSSFLH